MFNWNKKEKPLQGLMGVGGGATGYLLGGGGSVTASSGGSINDYGGYRYHTFMYPNSDDFVAGTDINSAAIDLLLIAGGGAGGSYYGAGGGAGGVVSWIGCPITYGNTYSMVIGDGAASIGPSTSGGSGDNSTFSGLPLGVITAQGGGGGSPTGNPAGSTGIPGGSGGGRGSVPGGPDAGGTGVQPSENSNYTPQSGFNQYGNPGGSYPTPSTGYAPGGGGGAGGAGGNGFQGSGAGPGGVGIALPQFPVSAIPLLSPIGPRMGPTSNYYGGGGGAGGYGAVGAAGGHGGGGAGHPKPGTNFYAGADGLGGGGGGRHPNAVNSLPTAGGSGICIIRYQVV